MVLVPLCCIAAVLFSVQARGPALPEDPYGFPKYRVTYLNALPLLNETAEQWLKEGIPGGELQFLDQPWSDDTQFSPPEIESGFSQQKVLTAVKPVSAVPPNYTLELMKMGPRETYLCLTPQPLDTPPVVEDEPTAVHSWSLLQPLSGTCLYYRTSWFTYSYCHNEQVRQFKELTQNHKPGSGYKPEEDPEWDSYTLGKAPATPEPGAELSVGDAANLELARGAGSRYLVQHWTDGTLCDKTGRPREVEVQFHCSMTMTDSILFVKEAKTCSYILVIETPRLCGEPGFKSRKDAREEAFIRCREVVTSINADAQAEQSTLPETDYPFKLPRRKHKETIISPPPTTDSEETKYSDIIRKAINTIAGDSKSLNLGDAKVVIERVTDNGDILLEVVDSFGNADPFPEADAEHIARVHDALAKALKSAGIQIQDPKPAKGEHDEKKKKTKKQESVKI